MRLDDVTTGSLTVTDCYEFYLKAKVRLLEAGFNLRKFVTNSLELWNMITTNEGQALENNPTLPREHKVLGVNWNPNRDELLFDLTSIKERIEWLEPTKRNIIGLAAQLYDAFGILSPITVSFKIFFQQLCKAGLQWDEPLTEELNIRWNTLRATTCSFDPVIISRSCIGDIEISRDTRTGVQLVGFCDASQQAYAVCEGTNNRCPLSTFIGCEDPSCTFENYYYSPFRIAVSIALSPIGSEAGGTDRLHFMFH